MIMMALSRGTIEVFLNDTRPVDLRVAMVGQSSSSDITAWTGWRNCLKTSLSTVLLVVSKEPEKGTSLVFRILTSDLLKT